MDLSDDQVQLLQEFIRDAPAGTYDAMDLIPESYRQYFAIPTEHGKQFKRAVDRRQFEGITRGEMDLGSKHWTYLI